MLNFGWLIRCSSVGTAEEGTDPGSVSVVFTWQERASAIRIEYSMAKWGAIPPLSASNVTVSAEYPISTHTMRHIMDPAGSFWFNQMPFSSDVPKEQE